MLSTQILMKRTIVNIIIFSFLFIFLTFGIFGFIKNQEQEETIRILEYKILNLEEKVKDCK